MGAEYVIRRSGPMSAQPVLLAVFARAGEEAPAPELQVHVSAASYDRVGGPIHNYPGITSSVCILRPESRGHVHASSPDPEAPPEILNNYLATDYDCEMAVEAVRLVRRIIGAPAMARFEPEEISPGRQFSPLPSCSTMRGSPSPPRSIRSAPARWAAVRTRLSIPSFACTA
jgi:choline dehydrogenase